MLDPNSATILGQMIISPAPIESPVQQFSKMAAFSPVNPLSQNHARFDRFYPIHFLLTKTLKLDSSGMLAKHGLECIIKFRSHSLSIGKIKVKFRI